MNVGDAEKRLEDLIEVSNQLVTYAKGFFLNNFQKDTELLISDLLRSVGAEKPNTVIVHQSVNTELQLKDAARYVSWRLAAHEAIWGLISSNLIIMGTSELDHNDIAINWTTVVGSGGGTSSTWYLKEKIIPVPRRLCLRPTGIYSSEQPLSDPDIFMDKLSIKNLNKNIEVSLREAVLCFKNELYLGCLALLGRASEGAWIELGSALAEVPSETDEKLRKCVHNQFTGIGRKISEIVKAYDKKNIYDSIYSDSGVRPQDLESCKIWSDTLRESRNSIHYNVKPFIPNKYEKVSALLISTVTNLNTIYSIINSCQKLRFK